MHWVIAELSPSQEDVIEKLEPRVPQNSQRILRSLDPRDPPVGFVEASAVGSGVGSAVGSGERLGVGSAEGSRAGSGVGIAEGSGVGSANGSGVGSRQGSAVESAEGCVRGSAEESGEGSPPQATLPPRAQQRSCGSCGISGANHLPGKFHLKTPLYNLSPAAQLQKLQNSRCRTTVCPLYPKSRT